MPRDLDGASYEREVDNLQRRLDSADEKLAAAEEALKAAQAELAALKRADRRIVCDAHTCFGKPRIEGTRLYLLAFVGMTREQVDESWPHLRLTDTEWAAVQAWLASPAGVDAQAQSDVDDEALDK